MDDISLGLKLLELGISGIFIAILLKIITILYRENRELYERIVSLETTYARKMQRTNELLKRLIVSTIKRIPAPPVGSLEPPHAPRSTIPHYGEGILSDESDHETSTPDLPAHLQPSLSPEPRILAPEEYPFPAGEHADDGGTP